MENGHTVINKWFEWFEEFEWFEWFEWFEEFLRYRKYFELWIDHRTAKYIFDFEF